MMKMDVGVPPYFEHIKDMMSNGTKIGVDPEQVPTGMISF